MPPAASVPWSIFQTSFGGGREYLGEDKKQSWRSDRERCCIYKYSDIMRFSGSPTLAQTSPWGCAIIVGRASCLDRFGPEITSPEEDQGSFWISKLLDQPQNKESLRISLRDKRYAEA